jgi:hypothetical protein
MGATREGKYANYFEMGYTRSEILVDFGQFDSEIQAGVRHTRIILNPASAKVFLKMLSEVLASYESEVESID